MPAGGRRSDPYPFPARPTPRHNRRVTTAPRLFPEVEPPPAGTAARAGRPKPRGRGVSPAMQQYLDLKREAGDAMLFFRMGDFYEVFFEDARQAGELLGIAVTSRQNDAEGKAIPMAGVPYHAAEGYIARLVRAGFRVAVCEQVEPPGLSKGPVRREIVRVATPSTYLDPAYLAGSEAAYLMVVAESGTRGSPRLGAAWVDLSTGEFTAAEFSGDSRQRQCAEAMAGFRPRELLLAESAAPRDLLPVLGDLPLLTARPDLWFEFEHARDTLRRHFGTLSLESFGIEETPAAVCAAGAAISYLAETQRGQLHHLGSLKRLDTSGRMQIDHLTQRNLELFRSLSAESGGPPGATLVDTLDRTATAMGARLLRRRLAHPLLDAERIRERHVAVEAFTRDRNLRQDVAGTLAGAPDLERLASRVALRIAGPREYLRVADGLRTAGAVRTALQAAEAPTIRDLGGRIRELPELLERIRATVSPEAPVLAREGGAIREGFSPELDELRRLRFHGRECIRNMEASEKRRTGITSLRIKHNQVFGYTIEVPKAQAGRVPSDYIRRQTLVGAERYVTEELKEFEARVAQADEKIAELEASLFRALEEEVGDAAREILEMAGVLAEADVAAGLAQTAVTHRYVRPEVHEGFGMEVHGGRHPVVEALSAEEFVPNDLGLGEDRFLMILTGPNMGGKSTFLRQTALHSVMAQMGSFVPAESARLPVVDRVFARVGASDDLSRGRSTFLMEMEETAYILHHATNRSLVLLDEVGRGTATYDGLSLAWAIVEHIARDPGLRMKTLFATHYHELTALASAEDGVVNFHVEAREHHNEIVFLHRVAPGGTNRSYGIEVARLAGVPRPVVRRAHEVLAGLAGGLDGRGARLPAPEPGGPYSLLEPAENQVAEAVRSCDPDRLSPREALDLLYRLRRRLDPGASGGGSGAEPEES
ncbi:MAG: DNA mismatch repair protein MutS [Acidobacteria bacterium]|nr:DNA mismatch repair protein MutS [Acidobacteriota bacterium]